ncbi:MAG: hypothetical protein WC405_13505 [Syntrophales bacterium]
MMPCLIPAHHLRIPPEYHFCVSAVPFRFQTVAERFLGRSRGHVEVVKLPL